MNASDYVLLAAMPLFLIAIAVELRWSRARGTPTYERRDVRASLTMGVGYVVIMAGWKLVELAAYTWAFNRSPFDLGIGPIAWVVAIVGVDLGYYAYHRAHHEVRVLWASHVVHHSSERYNLGTALRQTWTPMTNFLFYLPLALIGVRPLLILVSFSINLLYQFWIHTEQIDRLPRPVEYVFNTPSHHRAHHGSNSRYLDRNYGGILILWDRLFRSFEPESEPVRYGLTNNIRTFRPLRIAFHEYADIAADVRTASTWRQRLGHVVRNPGWRPATMR